MLHDRRDLKAELEREEVNEWQIAPQHAGILIVEQVRRQPASDLAQPIHDLVTNRDTTLANALYDWKPPTGWVRFRQ